MIDSEGSYYSTDIKNDKPNGYYGQLDTDYGQPNNDYGKFSNENSSERTVRNLDHCMQQSPRRIANTKDFNMSTNKKRETSKIS